MTHGEEMLDMETVLARVREELVVAIAADHRRSRRRHRARVLTLAIGVALAGFGTAVAATVGFFSPAPDSVKGVFEDINEGGGPAVDASKAIRIGVIDDHPAYAAPTSAGGFCLYFAPNQGPVQRSGPGGSVCSAHDPGPGEIVLTPQLGHDGGFVFGRVGSDRAAVVEIALPEGSGTLRTPVREEGFFLSELPQSAVQALAMGQTLTATANDLEGTTIARSTLPFEPTVLPTDAASPAPETASG